jgi:hypothetical protein
MMLREKIHMIPVMIHQIGDANRQIQKTNESVDVFLLLEVLSKSLQVAFVLEFPSNF